MFEKFFSKKILDSQILQIPSDLVSISAIAELIIEFEKQYPNKKKFPIYIYFERQHSFLQSALQFNILLRYLMDANVYFKFYFDILPTSLRYAYLPSNSYEIKDKQVNKQEEQTSNFQVIKIGDKPKNQVELEVHEIKDKFKNLFFSKKHLNSKGNEDSSSESTVNYLKILFSSSLIVFAIGLLGFTIFHLNPSLSIEIKPSSQSLEQVLNIALIDKSVEDQEIEDYLLNRLELFDVKLDQIKHSTTFSSTGKNFTGENAKGTVEVLNESAKSYNFVPYTRFQTQDGLIFRAQESVELLPGSKEQPYKVSIEVQADTLDLLANPVGELGNLPANTKLFIPGLNAKSQAKVYAVTTNALVGGRTEVQKFVKASDIQAAESFLLNDLKSKIPTLFQEHLAESFQKNQIQLEILNFDEAIAIENIEYQIDPDLVGQNIDGFTGSITATIKAKAFNLNDLKIIARNQLEQSVAPYTKLSFIDFPAMNYRLSRLPLNPKVQILTLVISGVQTFDLEKHPEFTLESITQILNNQAGSDPIFAAEFLQNLEPVSQVKIDVTPFWRKSIPHNLKNIELNYAKS